jgi:hypothetical protein
MPTALEPSISIAAKRIIYVYEDSDNRVVVAEEIKESDAERRKTVDKTNKTGEDLYVETKAE